MGYLTLLKYRMAASSKRMLKRLVHCEKGMETIEIIVLSSILLVVLIAGGILLRNEIASSFRWIAGKISGTREDGYTIP